MSFIKRASIKNMHVEALHVPQSGGWEFFNTSRIKTAGIDKLKDLDLGGFDIEAAIKEHSNHLFVKAFAIKQDEVNDNGDAFSAEELKKAAHTFIGVPVFVNHKNDDVEKSRGKVVHAWYDEDAGGIYVINRVDKEAYPQLARGIEESYITGTSMGAQVGYSCCSICHNKSATSEDFCSHIRNRKTRKMSTTCSCKYHESPSSPKDNCPICKSKKGESKELVHKEAQVFEWNYDIKFIEDSFVVNPACHDCLVCDILNIPKIEDKLSSNIEKMKQIAASIQSSTDSNKMEKTAGAKEIESLNQAMNLMETVARSMMAQKQIVSMDYVSDIVEQLSKLQETTDELIEMGYSQVPSPPQHEIMFGNNAQASPTQQPQAQQFQNPNMMQSQPQPSFGPPSSSSGADGVATVTKPTFSNSKKDFSRIADNTRFDVENISYIDNIINEIRRLSVAKVKETYSASNGDIKIVISKFDNDDIHVAEFKDNKLTKITSSTEFDKEIQDLLSSNEKIAAEKILSLKLEPKESKLIMANEKIAAGNGVNEEQTQVTTEKQLEKSKIELHPRTGSYYETTTEGKDQIGGKEKVNDTTTASPQVRSGSYDVITEEQFNSITKGYTTRWGEFPEVITEKQWDEMSRAVGAVLPDDWTDQVTQAQLISLRKDHRWEDPESITENQLSDQGKTMPGAGESSRWKSASADVLVKVAMQSVIDAIANYGLTPSDVSKAMASISSKPQSEIKASYLTLINAVPFKKASREAARERNQYFNNIGVSTNNSINPVDGLISAMADNIGYLTSENLISAVRRVVSNKNVLATAESSALDKIASRNNSYEVNGSMDDFDKILASYERSDDGLYKVVGTIATDLNGVNVKNASEFISAAYSFAKSKAPVKTILASLDVDSSGSSFEAVLKDVTVASKEESEAFANLVKDNFKAANISNFGDKKAPSFGKDDKEDKKDKKEDSEDKNTDTEKVSRSKAREDMIRQAQMMGGQMGGGMGGDPNMGGGMGGGASMPTPPAGGPGMESFESGGMENGPDDMMGGESDLEASPPGSFCPVCKSDDVDWADGKGKCNNCSSEFEMKVSIDVTKWSGLTGEGGDETSPGGPGGESEGEGFALPEGDGLEQSLPVAASTRLTPNALKKMAEAKINLGHVSPYNGSTNTVFVGLNNSGANEFHCVDTGKRYYVRTAQKGNDGPLFAQWEWNDSVITDCPSCRRNKKAFASAMNGVGFDTNKVMSLKKMSEKGKVILAAHNKGLFKTVKTASKDESVISLFKKAYTLGPDGKFPIESCREKLARRFGENAVALSGPCSGDNLVDCTCKMLARAGFYNDKVAIKLASTWAERDGCVECWEDYVRTGFSAENSAIICDSLKKAFAQVVDVLSDEISNMDSTPPVNTDPSGGMDAPPVDDGGNIFEESVDPFGQDSEQAGFVNIEIPLNVLEQLDQAFDVALGHDPAAEQHHDVGSLPSGEVQMEVPQQAVEQLDQVADQALDTAVGVGEAINEGGDNMGGEVEVETTIDESPVGDGSPVGDESSSVDDSVENVDSPSDDEVSDENTEQSESKDDSNPFDNNGESNEDKGNTEEKEEEIVMSGLMNRSRITSTGSVSNLNLDEIVKALKKKADSNLKQKNVQDDSDIGDVGGKGGSTMGKEEGFKAEKPDAPSKGSGSTMGKESKDLMPSNNTSVPAGGGEMGHEKELGYTSEKGHDMTGGLEGAGSSKAASMSHKNKTSKEASSSLVERILKSAGEKKLKEPSQLKDDSSIGSVSDNKDHSNTPEGMKIKPFEEGENAEVPEKGDGAFMGHEKESIGDVPKSPKNHPSFPAGENKLEKEKGNERHSPEKQDNDKGTVIAGSNAGSLTERREAAQKLAGIMIEKGIITASQISSKIAELSRYEVSQISDLEKAMFSGSVKKGLDAVAKGEQTPIVMSSKVQNANEELRNKLSSMFSSSRLNDLAENDIDTQIRKYKK